MPNLLTTSEPLLTLGQLQGLIQRGAPWDSPHPEFSSFPQKIFEMVLPIDISFVLS